MNLEYENTLLITNYCQPHLAICLLNQLRKEYIRMICMSVTKFYIVINKLIVITGFIGNLLR